jgi:N-acetylneuraminic acid mutarotase
MQHARAARLRIFSAIAVVIGFSVLIVAISPSSSSGAGDSGAWQTLASVPLPRQEVSYVRVVDKLYLAGGGANQRVYTPATNSWNSDPNVLPALGRLDHIQGVAVGGKIYYLGGMDMDANPGYPHGEVGTVKIFDPASPTLAAGAPMPAGRERGAGGVAVHDGRIFYFGGLHGGVAVKWVDVYDPVTNAWASLPDMATARDHAHAVALGGRIHLIGGRAGTFATTMAAHDAYNPDAGTWQSGLAPLPTPRGGFAAAVLGGEIVVLGGEGDTPGAAASGTVEAYDTVGDSWRTLTAMPTPRHGIQAATCSGSIYLAAGGLTVGYDPTTAHDRFTLGLAQPCTNAVPSCLPDALSTDIDTPVPGRLDCSDGDGDALAYSVVDAPDHGTLAGPGVGAVQGRPDAAGRFVYTPNAGYAGPDAFTVRATDGTLSSPATIDLQVGPGPLALLSPASHDFGSRDIDAGASAAGVLTLSNNGSESFSLSAISLTGPGASQFLVQDNGCGASLAPGASCDLSVVFDPSSTGAKTATLEIADSAPGSPHSATLTGTGSIPPVVPPADPPPADPPTVDQPPSDQPGDPPPTTPTTPTTPPDDKPALPAFAFAKLAPGQKTVPVNGGRTVRFALRCPAQIRPLCSGRLELSTRGIALGRRSYRIPQGQSTRLEIKLTTAGRRLVKSNRHTKAKLVLRFKDAQGHTKLRTTTAMLRSGAAS